MEDLTGRVFGRLTVVRLSECSTKKQRLWECNCECGNVTHSNHYNLLKDKATSCGCKRKDSLVSRNSTHGGARTLAYSSWRAAKRRCCDPKDVSYKNYGERGITMCDRWLKSFACFLADMGERGEDQSLERVNPDGNYEPANCMWIDKKDEQLNKRTSVFIEHEGETLNLSVWAKRFGIDRGLLRQRLKAGMTFEQAVNKPVKKRKK